MTSRKKLPNLSYILCWILSQFRIKAFGLKKTTTKKLDIQYEKNGTNGFRTFGI